MTIPQSISYRMAIRLSSKLQFISLFNFFAKGKVQAYPCFESKALGAVYMAEIRISNAF